MWLLLWKQHLNQQYLVCPLGIMFLIFVCLTIDQGLNLPSKFNSFVSFSIQKNLMDLSDLCLVHFYRTIDYRLLQGSNTTQ